MQAAWEDIELHQGTTFEKTWELLDEDGTPRDLSAWTGAFKIRDTAEDATELADGDVDCTSAGLVTATLTAAATAAMVWFAGVYDLTIAAGARVEPVSKGRAVLRRTVSR